MTEFQKYVLSIPLSDEDLARLVDVSRPSVTRWRAGEAEPHEVIKKMMRRKVEKE